MHLFQEICHMPNKCNVTTYTSNLCLQEHTVYFFLEIYFANTKYAKMFPNNNFAWELTYKLFVPTSLTVGLKYYSFCKMLLMQHSFPTHKYSEEMSLVRLERPLHHPAGEFRGSQPPKPIHGATEVQFLGGAQKSDKAEKLPFHLLTVSSLQIEWTWVPNMTAVKIRKRRPSKQRRMRRMTVAGGEKLLHSGEGRREKEEREEEICYWLATK